METMSRPTPWTMTDAGFYYWRTMVRRSGAVEIVGAPLSGDSQTELENCLATFAEAYWEYLDSAVAGELVFATADLIQFAVNNRVSLELEWLMDFAVRIFRQEESNTHDNEFRAYIHKYEMLHHHYLLGDTEDLAGGYWGVKYSLSKNHAVITDECIVIYKGQEFMAEDLEMLELDFSTPATSTLSYRLCAELMAKYLDN